MPSPEINASSAPQYQLFLIRYGTREAQRSSVFLEYHLYDEPDGPIGMDYFFWVLRGRDGDIVVDTGFSAAGGAKRRRDTVIEPMRALAEIGVSPSAVELLVMTHLHYDHTGHVDAFPDARILIPRSDYEFWMGPHAKQALFHHSVEDDELALVKRAHDEGRVELFEGGAEVAPGVEIIEVGGHSPGQSMLLVPTSEGIVLLASDAVHYYEEYERRMPFVTLASIVDMLDSFDTIDGLLGDGSAAHLVSGHDPATFERLAGVGRPWSSELGDVIMTIGSAPEGDA
ncbi:MAG TPA: N-acyl homoserine lactonase family protein [Solirubrobacteraceae bacterium]|jgi:glyoxylase-like metal-dependent hydrolase (beta-lactamase superfamily II)|nr:N-acyl homoserine lactonase family protein [Solirubrobacteraceae bacterium]